MSFKGSRRNLLSEGKRKNRAKYLQLRIYKQFSLSESFAAAHHEQRGTIFRLTPISKKQG